MPKRNKSVHQSPGCRALQFAVERLVFLASGLMQRQKCLQIYRVKNIGSVFELSGAAFRLAPAYGGLLVEVIELMVGDSFSRRSIRN